MKTIVIDRSKWRTGGESEYATGKGDTFLKNKEGYQCCLGFITSAYKKKTVGCPTPGSTGCKIPHLSVSSRFSVYGFCNTQLSTDAMEINDDWHTTPQEKERRVKELFAGKINLEFVGEFTKFKEKEDE